MNFSKFFFQSLSDKMTLCNTNDQAWFSDALTSAGRLRGRKKRRHPGSGFNITLGVQQMLMHRKTHLIPILPDVTSLKIEKNHANKLILIFTLKPSVCSSRVTFIVKKWTNQVLLNLADSVQIRAEVLL